MLPPLYSHCANSSPGFLKSPLSLPQDLASPSVVHHLPWLLHHLPCFWRLKAEFSLPSESLIFFLLSSSSLVLPLTCRSWYLKSFTVWPDQKILFQVSSLFLHRQTIHHSSVGWNFSICWNLLTSQATTPRRAPPWACLRCLLLEFLFASAPRALSTLFTITHKVPCGLLFFPPISLDCERVPQDQELDLIYLRFFLEPKSVLEMIFNHFWYVDMYTIYHRISAKGLSDFKYIQVVNSPSSLTSHDLPNVCVTLVIQYSELNCLQPYVLSIIEKK